MVNTLRTARKVRGVTTSNRTFNTRVREPWNPRIKHILNAIDHHTALYLDTQNPWHEYQASVLRAYLISLKLWISEEERGRQYNITNDYIDDDNDIRPCT